MRWCIAAAVVCLLGCTARMHAAPRRPVPQLALIHIDGTQLTRVDGQRATGNKLEVPPGIHSLGVAHAHGSLVVCFAARSGHSSRTRSVFAGREWRPEFVDETLAEPVKSWAIDPSMEHC